MILCRGAASIFHHYAASGSPPRSPSPRKLAQPSSQPFCRGLQSINRTNQGSFTPPACLEVNSTPVRNTILALLGGFYTVEEAANALAS